MKKYVNARKQRRGTFRCDGWAITPEEVSANFNAAPTAQLLLLSPNHGNKLKERDPKIAHMGLTLHRYTQWGFGRRWLCLIMCLGGACVCVGVKGDGGLAVMPDLNRWDRVCNLNASGRQFKHMAVRERDTLISSKAVRGSPRSVRGCLGLLWERFVGQRRKVVDRLY